VENPDGLDIQKIRYRATGRKAYSAGDWQAAMRMVTTVKMGAQLTLCLAAALHHA
jgi:hypothetical protein